MPIIGKQFPVTALTASDIADGIISTAKIADDAATPAKANFFNTDPSNAADLGHLHIKTGDSSGSASADADELVIEGSANSGITILGGTGNGGRIHFGDSGDNDIGYIIYAHDDNALNFGCNAATKMTIASNGITTIDSGASGTSQTLQVKSSGSTGGFVGSEGANNLIMGSGDACWKMDPANNIYRPFSADSGGGIDDTHDIGASAHRFDDIYASNGSIQTSDKNEKNTIVASDLGLEFIDKLTPVSYKFNGKNRTHYGLIAQDVETVLSDISKDTNNFAGFIKTEIKTDLEKDLTAINTKLAEGVDIDGVEYTDEMKAKLEARKTQIETGIAAEYRYGLRYNEFISPIVKAIQELSTRVKALEDE